MNLGNSRKIMSKYDTYYSANISFQIQHLKREKWLTDTKLSSHTYNSARNKNF